MNTAISVILACVIVACIVRGVLRATSGEWIGELEFVEFPLRCDPANPDAAIWNIHSTE